MARTGAAAAVLGCLALITTRAHAVQGGALDRTTSHAVAIATGGPASPVLRCSGTLISPNVVLTARHCVSRLSPEGPSCEKSFGETTGRPADLWVDASSRVAPRTSWKNVASWTLPEHAGLCGNDVALLVLAAPFEAHEVSPARVVLTEAELLAAVKPRRFGLAGFGASSGSDSGFGVRRSRFDIPLVCLPGAPGFACNGALAYIDPSELTGGAGPCSGDSGAGAIVDGDRNAIFGVLSRGDGASEACTEGVFERTDVWRWLIAKTVLQAAEPRASAPAWARDAFPAPAAVGELCLDAAACGESSDCVSVDGRRSFVCARRCSAGCADSERCESDVCVAAAERERDAASGCSMAPRSSQHELAWWLAVPLAMAALRIVAIELASLASLRRLGRRRRRQR